MAADAYLKVAAGQLQQAANEMKREASDIRGMADSNVRNMERDLVGLQSNAKAEELAVASSKIPQEQALHTAQARRLRQQAEELEQKINQVQSQSQQAAGAKESVIQDLNGQAQNMQRMAGDPRLR